MRLLGRTALAVLVTAALAAAATPNAFAGSPVRATALPRNAAAASDIATPPVSGTPSDTVLKLSAPATIAAKGSATVVATLSDASGTPLPGRTIKVEQITSAGRRVVFTGATSAAGELRGSVKPTSRTVLEAVFLGDLQFAASASDRVVIMPRVLLAKPWTHDSFAYPGQRLPARGTLWPKHSSASTGTTIVCERKEGAKWVVRARFKARVVNTSSGSRYEGVIQLPKTGTWRVRAKHGDGSHAVTQGASRTITVSRWRDRYRGRKMGGFRSSEKLVAITIDDGPNGRTSQICDILERYGARGTFFFIDHLLKRGYTAQAKSTYDRGHEIANHTARHKSLRAPYSTAYAQAKPAIATIRKATGFDPIWIRAMGGNIDSVGMRAVVNTNQLYCNWSIDSYDSHAQYTPPSVLYRNVVRSVRPGDVILIHQTHPETVQALPSICRELRRRGYRMVTLSELAARSTPRR